MFSTNFIFRQQENLVDNQKCWAGFRPLCNKILFLQYLNFTFIPIALVYLTPSSNYRILVSGQAVIW